MKKNKKRIVVLGSNSFVAKNVIKNLQKEKKKITVIKISKKKIDLEKRKNVLKLKSFFKEDDTIFFVAARAPAKNHKDYLYNLRICKNIILALEKIKISHLIYLSSDAVYSDIDKKIHENSPTKPKNYHGLMHLKRENLIKKKFGNVLTIVRPTLIYGIKDPHNGYGPNKFMRLAKKNKKIEIFGKGEELRDHVYIDDVSNIIKKIIFYKNFGIYNIASGKVVSFLNIANQCIKMSKSKSKILRLDRKINKLPHNGYRPFDIKKLKKLINKNKITQLDTGIRKLY